MITADFTLAGSSSLWNGQVIIPPMAIKKCLTEAAELLSGKAFAEHFEAGILCLSNLLIHDRNGSPVIDKGWTASGYLIIVDHTITQDVLTAHFETAGRLIGLGRSNGRFHVTIDGWTQP